MVSPAPEAMASKQVKKLMEAKRREDAANTVANVQIIDPYPSLVILIQSLLQSNHSQSISLLYTCYIMVVHCGDALENFAEISWEGDF